LPDIVVVCPAKLFCEKVEMEVGNYIRSSVCVAVLLGTLIKIIGVGLGFLIHNSKNFISLELSKLSPKLNILVGNPTFQHLFPA
jgi:hypothetical protein